MKNILLTVLAVIAAFIGGYFISDCTGNSASQDAISQKNDSTVTDSSVNEVNELKLGAFSISLSVKDLKKSKDFYEKLGFFANGGSLESNYLIMKNENALIGLFQGMFEGNILTFNPGWNENAENIESFDDVRLIQSHIKDQGIDLMLAAPDSTIGPASIMLVDPDSNLILIDQHR